MVLVLFVFFGSSRASRFRSTASLRVGSRGPPPSRGVFARRVSRRGTHADESETRGPRRRATQHGRRAEHLARQHHRGCSRTGGVLPPRRVDSSLRRPSHGRRRQALRAPLRPGRHPRLRRAHPRVLAITLFRRRIAVLAPGRRHPRGGVTPVRRHEGRRRRNRRRDGSRRRRERRRRVQRRRVRDARERHPGAPRARAHSSSLERPFIFRGRVRERPKRKRQRRDHPERRRRRLRRRRRVFVRASGGGRRGGAVRAPRTRRRRAQRGRAPGDVRGV